jgi:hypothetical protein
MKRLIPLLCLLCSTAFAEVVRPAPDFTFPAAEKKPGSLKALRGQAVVLLIADSPKRSDLIKQLRYLEEIYQQFAGRHVVFAVALTGGASTVPSTIPFATVEKPDLVAAAYGGSTKFQLVVIGKDGNIDYQTQKVCTGQRIRDVIQNSFAVQTAGRGADRY